MSLKNEFFLYHYLLKLVSSNKLLYDSVNDIYLLELRRLYNILNIYIHFINMVAYIKGFNPLLKLANNDTKYHLYFRSVVKYLL